MNAHVSFFLISRLWPTHIQEFYEYFFCTGIAMWLALSDAQAYKKSQRARACSKSRNQYG